jgi:quercetin dioxygenase-like cupin family protein
MHHALRTAIAGAALVLLPAVVSATHDGMGRDMWKPTEMRLTAGPPSLPPGARMIVLSGDPAAEGPFTVRVTFPEGYAIPPHWHPTDEHVTVISGTLNMGHGDTLDKTASTALPAGSFAVMHAESHHYAWTKRGAVVQVHAMGPFEITYINPADDPRRAKPD